MVQIPSWAFGAILGPLLAMLLGLTALLSRSLEQLKMIAQRLETLEKRSEAQAEQHQRLAILQHDHDGVKQRVAELAGLITLQADEVDALDTRVDRIERRSPGAGGARAE